MTVKEAYELGVNAGHEAGSYTERGTGETWVGAAFESETNARQYAGHYSEDLRTEAQWDAYEKGVGVGITKGLKERGIPKAEWEAERVRKNKGRELKIGDVVTVKQRVEAFYSGYAGRPKVWLEPGETGVIGGVKVPKVYASPGGAYYYCIDFFKGGEKQRASANYGNIQLIRGSVDNPGDVKDVYVIITPIDSERAPLLLRWCVLVSGKLYSVELRGLKLEKSLLVWTPDDLSISIKDKINDLILANKIGYVRIRGEEVRRVTRSGELDRWYGEEAEEARKNPSSAVQSFHFPKDKWSLAEAKRWLTSHGYKTGRRMDEPHFVEYRFRQEQPGKFKRIWKVPVRSRTFRKMLYMLRGHLK